MKGVLRLILDEARSPALNMAIDEMLAEAQIAPDALPTLRFYTWSEPALSVGYFQNPEVVFRKFGAKRPVVRRLTGGGLVAHGEDLTFSLTLPHPNAFLPRDVKSSYLIVHEALRAGLLSLYPGIDYADCKNTSARGKGDRVCFDNPSCYDLLLDGRKAVGASQRRLGAALLHQSSVFLPGDKADLAQKLVAGFVEKWKVEVKALPLSLEELEKARIKERQRYATVEWAFPDALTCSFLSKHSGQL